MQIAGRLLRQVIVFAALLAVLATLLALLVMGGRPSVAAASTDVRTATISSRPSMEGAASMLFAAAAATGPNNSASEMRRNRRQLHARRCRIVDIIYSKYFCNRIDIVLLMVYMVWYTMVMVKSIAYSLIFFIARRIVYSVICSKVYRIQYST